MTREDTTTGLEMETEQSEVKHGANPNAVDISPKKDGGVLKEIIKEGTGDALPFEGCKVFVHYVGTLLNGEKFDSSRDRQEPFEFKLGKGSVIKAWDIGVATMKKGEIAVFTCKPEYAYGKAGSPPKIPADSTLVFEIEMLRWQGDDLSPKKDGGIMRQIIKKGEGYLTPNEGAEVEAHLVGKVGDSVFEDRTVKFPLGEGSEFGVCEGVERALEKFQKGEKSVLKIAPKYGFGALGNSELKVAPNTDLEYTVELKNFIKCKESWSLDSDEKLEQARYCKERGTDYFKAEKYPLAVKLYKRAFPYVEHETGFDEKQEEQRKSLLSALRLNLAMCHLKLEEHIEARDCCNDVLKEDPTNVKALFRRGQAYLGIGEPELAKQDFEHLLQLEPNNKAAANHIIICNKKLKEQRGKEKKIYANMFEKFAQRDREKEEQWRRNQPDVMKALGEWGEDEREREMTDFERENPNILMLNGTGEFKNM